MAAEALRQSSAGRRIGGLLLALVNLAGAIVVALVGLIADGLRCDDSCSVAPGWRNDPSAWQWHGSFILSLVILGSALVLAVAVLLQRARSLGSVAVGVQLAALVILEVLAWTATETHRGSGSAVVLFGFFAATGVGAARSA